MEIVSQVTFTLTSPSSLTSAGHDRGGRTLSTFSVRSAADLAFRAGV